jgi:hypothetical protein
MRKRIVSHSPGGPPVGVAQWFDVERHAEIEVTSEDPARPIESALHAATGNAGGWRAAEPGPQTIRLRFDEPQRLERTRLVFDEQDVARTQEFVLRWSADGGRTYREIVRQQYTFSPSGSVREVEDYAVGLEGVTALELHIVPDISGGATPASLSEWTIVAHQPLAGSGPASASRD